MYISLLKLNQCRVWIRTLSPTSLSPSLFSLSVASTSLLVPLHPVRGEAILWGGTEGSTYFLLPAHVQASSRRLKCLEISIRVLEKRDLSVWVAVGKHENSSHRLQSNFSNDRKQYLRLQSHHHYHGYRQRGPISPVAIRMCLSRCWKIEGKRAIEKWLHLAI